MPRNLISKNSDLQIINSVLTRSSPEAIAVEYKSRYGQTLAAANAIVKNACKKSFGTGWISATKEYESLGIQGDAFICIQMVGAIAALYGYDLSDDEVQANIHLCLGITSASNMFKRIVLSTLKSMDEDRETSKYIPTDVKLVGAGSGISTATIWGIGKYAIRTFGRKI